MAHDIRQLLRAGAAAPQSAPDISRLRTRARRRRAAVSVTALATVLVLVGGAGAILTRPSEVLFDGSHGASPDAGFTDGSGGVEDGPTETESQQETSGDSSLVSPPTTDPAHTPTSPSPAPDRQPSAEPDDPGEALWGRTFVSVEVTEGGRPRPLIDGTRLEVTFERRDDGADVVRWWAGCNSTGAPVRVSADRLDVGDTSRTGMGCDDARHSQDDWTASFFAADPFWTLLEDGLRLTAGDTVIEFSLAR